MERICVHVPHASTTIPDDIRYQFSVSDELLQEELLRLTDWYTDDLFKCDFGTAIVVPVSRFVVDVERFDDDAVEPMAKKGMGVIYTHGTYCTAIRSLLRPEEREQLLDRYYRPHHAYLNSWASEFVTDGTSCLLIDSHSFPSKPLPCDMNQIPNRPDICIGTDSFHTPFKLESRIVDGFKEFGYTVQVNEPYAGTMVPANVYQRDRRALSIMIEINRSLYMDESSGSRSASYGLVKRHISHVLNICQTYLAADGGELLP